MLPAKEITLQAVLAKIVAAPATAAAQATANAALAAIQTAIDLMAGTGLTFSTIAVSVTAGARQNIAFEGSKISRLHFLFGAMSLEGTLAIESADDAAGTNAVILCTAVPLSTNAGPVIGPTSDKRLCLATTAVSKYLNLVAVTGNFTGYAVISKATA